MTFVRKVYEKITREIENNLYKINMLLLVDCGVKKIFLLVTTHCVTRKASG